MDWREHDERSALAQAQRMERERQIQREREEAQATADFLEFRLIEVKQSRLSANERRAVVRRVEMRRAITMAAGGER